MIRYVSNINQSIKTFFDAGEAYQPPFNLVDKKVELLNRLQSVAGTSLKVNLYCWYIRLSALRDETTLKKMLEVLSWAISEIQLL